MAACVTAPHMVGSQARAWRNLARIAQLFHANRDSGVITHDHHRRGGREDVRCERSPPKASRTHAHRTAHTSAAESAVDHEPCAPRCGQGRLLGDQRALAFLAE